jgi:predicted HTH domain antitoxin
LGVTSVSKAVEMAEMAEMEFGEKLLTRKNSREWVKVFG